MVSDMPIVKGEGPLDDPTSTPAVRNSRLPTLSALEIGLGEMRPREAETSPLREGGRGMTIPLEGRVGVWREAFVASVGWFISPSSENKSPKSTKIKINN